MDLFKNQPETANIPQEKLDFLTEFAKQGFSSDANQLAGQLSSAAKQANEKGYTFNQTETQLLIELLKKNMSPAEQKKADQIIQLVNAFRPH